QGQDYVLPRGQQNGLPQGNKKARPGRAFLIHPENPDWEFGAQKRTRTSTPFRVPAPEAGASTNSAIWATERHVEGAPPCVNRLFEVFATTWRKPHVAQNMRGGFARHVWKRCSAVQRPIADAPKPGIQQPRGGGLVGRLHIAAHFRR